MVTYRENDNEAEEEDERNDGNRKLGFLIHGALYSRGTQQLVIGAKTVSWVAIRGW